MKPITRQSSTTEAQRGKRFSHSGLLGSWAVCAFPWLYLLAALLVLATSPSSPLPQSSLSSQLFFISQLGPFHSLSPGREMKGLTSRLWTHSCTANSSSSHKMGCFPLEITMQPPSQRRTDPSRLAAFSPDTCCGVDTSIAGKTPTQRLSLIKMCLALSQQSPGD